MDIDTLIASAQSVVDGAQALVDQLIAVKNAGTGTIVTVVEVDEVRSDGTVAKFKPEV